MDERGSVMRLAMMGMALVGLALAGVLAVTAHENPEHVQKARAKIRAWLDEMRAAQAQEKNDAPRPAPGEPSLLLPEPLAPSPPELPPGAPAPAAPSGTGILIGPEEPALPPQVRQASAAPGPPGGASSAGYAHAGPLDAGEETCRPEPGRHAARSSPPRPAAAQHVVRQGETLCRIARRYYNDPAKWRVIARANGIRDPRKLRAGATVTIPEL